MQKFCRSRTELTKSKRKTTDSISRPLNCRTICAEHLKKHIVSTTVREGQDYTITLRELAQRVQVLHLALVPSCHINFLVAATIAKV